MNDKKKVLVFFALAGLIICCDQITKIYVHTNFFLGESIQVFPSFFNITSIRNTGAAFGFLHNHSGMWKEIFFFSLAPIACIIILVLLKEAKKSWVYTLGLSLVFGGAIGNYIDRLYLGFVVDFIDIYYREFHWPAFNIADSSIVVGVGFLLYAEYIHFKQKKELGDVSKS